MVNYLEATPWSRIDLINRQYEFASLSRVNEISRGTVVESLGLQKLTYSDHLLIIIIRKVVTWLSPIFSDVRNVDKPVQIRQSRLLRWMRLHTLAP